MKRCMFCLEDRVTPCPSWAMTNTCPRYRSSLATMAASAAPDALAAPPAEVPKAHVIERYGIYGDPLIPAAQAAVSAAPSALAAPVASATPPLAPPETIVAPHHYARFPIEPIRFICENKLDWFQGNVVKYVCRHDAKNGIEDLKKAKRYLEMYITFLQKDPTWWAAP